MKKWLKHFPITYTFISIPMGFLGWITNLIPRLQGQVYLFEIVMGSLLIAILINTARSVYMTKWGNGFMSIFLALMITLPIPMIIRLIYFPILARLIGLIYAIMVLYLIVYTVIIQVRHSDSRKISDELNDHLKKDKKR